MWIVGRPHEDGERLRPHPQQFNIGPGVLVVGRVDHLYPVHHRGSIHKGLFEFDDLPFGKWWLGVTGNCHFSRLTLNTNIQKRKKQQQLLKEIFDGQYPSDKKDKSYFFLRWNGIDTSILWRTIIYRNKQLTKLNFINSSHNWNFQIFTRSKFFKTILMLNIVKFKNSKPVKVF